ncbi:hypothetical protein FRB90_008218, partial [Tulasnella sp. 427]
MMETMQYDNRIHNPSTDFSPRASGQFAGDVSPAGRGSPAYDDAGSQRNRALPPPPEPGHYYHSGGEVDDDDDGFYGRGARNEVDTPPPAPPASIQAPQSHYQIQQQQQQQYRRTSQQHQQQQMMQQQQYLGQGQQQPDSRRASGIIPSPPSPPPLFDHSHLRPGKSAQLLSADKTLEMYRQNAKKSSDPEIQFQFAVLMLDAMRSPPPPPNPGATQYDIEKANEQREAQVKDAIRMLQKLADRGHHEAQYFLADCYANGIGTNRGRQDFDKAYPLFVQAAKHRHADAAYRAGICCENGWGCRRDSAKAVQFYRTAGSLQHPGAMYRLGIADLNGELGLPKRPKEGVKWLKRSSEHATAEFPHALHELALLHET